MSKKEKSKELKLRIIRQLKLHRDEGISKMNIATILKVPPTSVSYHLTRLRKLGRINTEKGKWFWVADTVTQPEIEIEKEPETDVESEPSLKVLLYTARESVNAAITALEEIEQRIRGE